ncbi:glycosyltransferase family 4 protein [Blastococcus sp. SYSU DS0541]
MRVAVVLEQVLSRVPGGTGRYAGEVAEALARRASPGDSVTGWTAWHRDAGAARRPGVRGPRRLPLPARPLTVAWQVGAPPRPRGADVVHAPTLLAPPRRRGVPLVVTVHDAVPWTHPGTLTPRGVRWHRAMAQRVGRGADAVVVPTEAVARELRDHVELRAPVVVAGAGVSDRLRAPADAADRLTRLGLTGGHLVTVATLEPRKGLDVLLTALAAAGGELPPLAVVGHPGWGGIDPSAMATDLGLPDGSVRLLGGVSDADLAAVLSGAVLAVVPSRAEGFGLPVVEAMAAGVPVVTSDAPALVEVGGGATRVVPAGDGKALAGALEELIADPGERAALRAAGLARAADFTWDAVADRLWSLYARL